MMSCALSFPSFGYSDNGINLGALASQKNTRKGGGGGEDFRFIATRSPA